MASSSTPDFHHDPGLYRMVGEAMRWSQPWFSEASAFVVMTLVLPRTLRKYRFDRGIRDCLHDLGHVGQTPYLIARGLGLGTIVSSVGRENPLEALLELDGVTESVAYVAALGVPSSSRGTSYRPLDAEHGGSRTTDPPSQFA